MKYEKNQYSEGISICGLIFAGAFIFWGINTLARPKASWLGLYWLGFLWLGLGLSILAREIRSVLNRGKLRKVVKTEFIQNPTSTVEEIVKNTGISEKDVKAIILDLKASGELVGIFSPETGKLEKTRILPARQEVIIEKKPGNENGKFCSNCGTPVIREGIIYCSYCGSRL
ncbi:MAG: hypothetical protein ACTSYC_00140 [Promethearchaeota archaeon]